MLRRLLRGDASWQFLDQAAVSAGNFITTLAIARTVPPQEYGTFSLLFLSLIAINTLHASLVVYPLTLTAATAGSTKVGRIAAEAVVQTLALAPIQSLVLAGTAIFVHRLDVLFYLVLAMVAWQIQESARRTLLADQRARTAFVGDAVSYIGQGCLVALLRPHSLAHIFLLIAVTSMAAALLQLVFLKVEFSTIFSREHFVAAWRLGRFTLGGNLLNMVSLQFPSWCVAGFVGQAGVANFQAIGNLGNIANPIILSTSNMLIPTIARASLESRSAARRVMYVYGARFGSLLLPPLLLLLLTPYWFMRVVYSAHSPYLVLSPYVRLYALAMVLQYVGVVTGAYEGGRGRPKTYMHVQAIATVTLLVSCAVLIPIYGLVGAIFSVVVTNGVRVLAFVVLSRYNDSREDVNASISVFVREDNL